MANLTIDIGNGFYTSDSLPLANQRCVNLYPNFPQAPALKSSSLFEVQGLEEVANAGRMAKDRNRGAWDFQGVPYFIQNDGLYRLNRLENLDGTFSYSLFKVGSITGQGLCSIADNGRQLIIINDQGEGFIYEPASSPQFEAITDAGFTANGTPKYVQFVDGYFLVTTSSNKVIISAVQDGKRWNALDFFSAESDPDGIAASFVFKNQFYVLGGITAEQYRNIGGAGVPFQRVNGFLLSQGCSAPNSVISLGNQVMWVGRGENEQPVIWRFTGGDPEKVSTTAIDNEIHKLTENKLRNIFSWSYSLRGHEFVAFSSSEWCFVFDVATGKWHERESIVDANGVRVTKRCRIQTVITAYNELFVGDTEDGRIGRIDEQVHQEYEFPLRSFFTTSPLYDLGNSFSLPSIELVCESGVGTKETPQPEVRLEISRDGVAFENPRTRCLGQTGDRQIRQIWYKNGRVSRFCVFKFTVSDPVKRRFYGVDISYKRGLHG